MKVYTLFLKWLEEVKTLVNFLMLMSVLGRESNKFGVEIWYFFHA